LATELLFREDAYATTFDALVERVDDGVVVLDRTLFYPQGGGQPGDAGTLYIGDSPLEIVGARHGRDGEVEHLIDDDKAAPAPGDWVSGRIDWSVRYPRMRMHTALHLLSAAVGAPVSGGSLSESKGRLDFDMPETTLDAATLEPELDRLLQADYAVTAEWISDAELDAQPELIKTMSVRPPTGAGRVRLIRIGDVDLQPCGGTHVARTHEIGKIQITGIEKKSRHNRRVNLAFAEA
jgi:misacylated tRNA(Ala) deacylase